MSLRKLNTIRYKEIAGVMRKDTSVPAIISQEEGSSNIVKLDKLITNCIMQVDLHVDGNQGDVFRIGIKTDDSLANGTVIGVIRSDRARTTPAGPYFICRGFGERLYKTSLSVSTGMSQNYSGMQLCSCQSSPMDEKFRIWLECDGTVITFKFYRWEDSNWVSKVDGLTEDGGLAESGYIYLSSNYSAIQILQTKIVKEEAKSISWSSV